MKKINFHILRSGYADYSNPCHNPAGTGGGQFCGGAGGGIGSPGGGTTGGPPPGKPLHLFHGTTTNYIKSIRENGLIPGEKPGSDAWFESATTGGRPVSVYLTPNLGLAQTYAELVSELHGGKPVILKVVVPPNHRWRVKEDEFDSNSFRFEGKIYKEWIFKNFVKYSETEKFIFYILSFVDEAV